MESAERLIRAASLIARTIPADVNIELATDSGVEDRVTRIQSAIPEDIAATIIPSDEERDDRGHTFLIIDAGAHAPDHIDQVSSERDGPLVFVPDSIDESMPAVPRNILVALTAPGDETAAITLPLTIRIVLGSGASVAMTAIFDLQDSGGDKASYSDYYLAQRNLSGIAEQLRDRQIRTTWEIRTGPAAEELVRLAQTTSPDLIIVSPSLESVAQQVARRASIPVVCCGKLSVPSQNGTST